MKALTARLMGVSGPLGECTVAADSISATLLERTGFEEKSLRLAVSMRDGLDKRSLTRTDFADLRLQAEYT
jgi:hypothetical protein